MLPTRLLAALHYDTLPQCKHLQRKKNKAHVPEPSKRSKVAVHVYSPTRAYTGKQLLSINYTQFMGSIIVHCLAAMHNLKERKIITYRPKMMQLQHNNFTISLTLTQLGRQLT